MEREPRRWIVRLLEWAALFALAAFLLRLGVIFLKEIWWVLLIIGAVVGGGIIGYRIYRNHISW